MQTLITNYRLDSYIIWKYIVYLKKIIYQKLTSYYIQLYPGFQGEQVIVQTSMGSRSFGIDGKPVIGHRWGTGYPSLWPSGIGSRLGGNRLWVRFLAVSDIYPMFIEPTITWVPSGFSGYIWLDTKIVLKKFLDIDGKQAIDLNSLNLSSNNNTLHKLHTYRIYCIYMSYSFFVCKFSAYVRG